MHRSTLDHPRASGGLGFPRDQIAFRRIRVAIYLRVSTEEQLMGFGLEEQEEVDRRWVEDRSRFGYELIGVYADKGVSGTVIERPQLMRLGQDARAGKIDVVLVYKFDRIGRVGRAFWRWVWELEDCGVAVASATQDIDTSTPAGLMALQQYASFAEMEHGMIVDRMQGGLNAKARNGGWVGGKPPYGYEIADKGTRKSSLVISRAEAETIMIAYDLFVSERLGAPEVAVKLNAQGRFTRSGLPWDANNLRKIFKENSFAGSYTFRKTTTAKKDSGVFAQGQAHGKYGPPIVVEIPAILSKSEAAQLAEALERSARKGGTQRVYEYPLSRRIIGSCGKHYTGHAHTDDGVRYYVCSGKEARGGRQKCNDRALLADPVEQNVWQGIVAKLNDPETVRGWASDYVAEMPGNTVALEARVADLTKQLAAQDEAITTTVVDYAKQKLPASVVGAAVAQLNEERNALATLLVEAEASLSELREREAVARNLEELVAIAQQNIADMGANDKRRMIELLDIRVTIKSVVASGRGRPCKITAWFTENEVLVPESMLTDEQWDRAKGALPASQLRTPGSERRTREMVEAVLTKVRTGCAWSDLPSGSPEPVATNIRAARWLRDGTWVEFVKALGSYKGTKAAVHRPLPTWEITGALDIRKNARRETSGSMPGDLRVTIPLKF